MKSKKKEKELKCTIKHYIPIIYIIQLQGLNLSINFIIALYLPNPYFLYMIIIKVYFPYYNVVKNSIPIIVSKQNCKIF